MLVSCAGRTLDTDEVASVMRQHIKYLFTYTRRYIKQQRHHRVREARMRARRQGIENPNIDDADIDMTSAYAAAERDPEGCAYTAFRAKVVSALYALQRRKAITRLKSGKYRFPRQQEG